MAGTIQDFASAVDKVIGICRDAEQGYRGAADAVADPSLKQRFEQLSVERAQFALELQTAVRALGFEPTHPSGLAGTLHGTWMHIKGAFTGHNPHTILEETERGEDESLRVYREALNNNLPPQLRSVMEAQFSQIQRDHVNIRTLRDESAPPAAPSEPPPPHAKA